MKTAVGWLHTKLSTCTSDEMVGNINNWFEQAKEMEKQKIVDAVEWGNRQGYDNHTLTCINDDDVRYYNETFKSE